MGKKYIVEIGRLERLYKASISAKGMPNMTWLSPEVDLTPYTEPDLELIKKEAHDNGYSEGYQDGYSKGMNDYLQSPEVKEESDRAYAHGYSDAESKFSEIRKEAYDKGFEDGKELCPLPKVCHNNAYQNGLSAAWDAARKLWEIDISTLHKIFYKETRMDCYMYYTAAEVIEKLQAYEQEQEEKKKTDYYFEMMKDAIETSAKEYGMSLDEVAEVIESLRRQAPSE